jgi:hypothetical protein
MEEIRFRSRNVAALLSGAQSNVKTRFGKLWTLYSDAKIMARPLYVSHLVSANIFKDAEP